MTAIKGKIVNGRIVAYPVQRRAQRDCTGFSASENTGTVPSLPGAVSSPPLRNTDVDFIARRKRLLDTMELQTGNCVNLDAYYVERQRKTAKD